MDLSSFPATAALVREVLAVWPEHATFLTKRFTDREMAHLRTVEDLAQQIRLLSGADSSALIKGYRWMCDAMLAEYAFFARHCRYRLSTFAEAKREVYDHPEIMTLYMDGLLASQVLWANHTEVIRVYRDHYLTALPDGADHLEVGPGHGLLLSQAARLGRLGRLVGWDVSETSVAATAQVLKCLGADAHTELSCRDPFNGAMPDDTFDSLVLSELLEHLEQPGQSLVRAVAHLRPGGHAFIHVPVNSPAPDHIALFSTPESVVRMVEDAGLRVTETHFIPATGYTEAQARKMKTTISTLVIARRDSTG